MSDEIDKKVNEQLKAVKMYHLTPKALRFMIALKEFHERIEELKKMTDEEIIKLADDEGIRNEP